MLMRRHTKLNSACTYHQLNVHILIIQIFRLVIHHQWILVETVVDAVRLRMQQQLVQIFFRFNHQIVAGRRQIGFADAATGSANDFIFPGDHLKVEVFIQRFANVEVSIVLQHGVVQFLALAAQVCPVSARVERNLAVWKMRGAKRFILTLIR